jgi:endoglucanase
MKDETGGIMRTFNFHARSLLLAGLTLISDRGFAALSATLPLPADGVIPAANFYTKTAGGAVGTSGWDLWSNGNIAQTINFPENAVYQLAITASGTIAANVWPAMQVSVDNKVVMSFSVDPTKQLSYTGAALNLTLAAGSHLVSIAFTNDYYAPATREDRNLFVYSLNVEKKSNPFSTAKFLVNPTSEVVTALSGFPAGSPDWNTLNLIAKQPLAIWLGDWNPSFVTDNLIAKALKQADATNQMPVFVIYAIPNRDCGSYSAGGFKDKASYIAFIDTIIADIGTHKSLVLYEPDALAAYPDCPTAVGRLDIMSTAIQHLTSHKNLYVYLESGNPGYKSAAKMNNLIPQVDPQGLVRGYSVNTSGFQTTANDIAFCKALLPAKPCVIDTSRNGNGSSPDGQWCNPPGRAVGRFPTGNTGDPSVDAFLWTKTPGDSDGTCNNQPPAGTFVPSIALDMAHAAGY